MTGARDDGDDTTGAPPGSDTGVRPESSSAPITGAAPARNENAAGATHEVQADHPATEDEGADHAPADRDVTAHAATDQDTADGRAARGSPDRASAYATAARPAGVAQGSSGKSPRWMRIVPAAYSLALALLIVGPLLGSGYLLLRDAVSTPRSYATDAALGLGDAAPRAVPQDGLLAALTVVVDGGIVVKAIVVLALTAAGWGAAVMVRRLLRVSLAPQLVAATVAVWNPYIAERLLQGHWSLLAGYAALPWTVIAALRIRRRTRSSATPAQNAAGPDQRRPTPADTTPAVAGPNPQPPSPTGTADGATGPGPVSPASTDMRRTVGSLIHSAVPWLILGGILAAAGLTPTGSLLAGLIAVLLVGRRNLPGTVGLWLLSAGPWLVATALSGSGTEPSDPAGVVAFAARAEPGLGTLGSLAGLGGIWNADAVPDSRTTLVAVLSTAVLLVIVVCGVRAVASTGDSASRYPRRALLILAVLAIVLPALGATGWGLSAGEFLVEHVPGAGLLRDTQKFVALAMPAFALCAAAGCRALATFRRAKEPDPNDTSVAPQPLLATLFIAALLLTLPDLAWGVGGSIRPVHYPAAWQHVAEKVDGPGDVAVLPPGCFAYSLTAEMFPYWTRPRACCARMCCRRASCRCAAK